MPLVDELRTLITYYEAKLSDKQIDLYIDALSDIELDDLHSAVVEIVKTSKWMPKISEIRTAAMTEKEKRTTNEVQEWKKRNIPASPWLREGPANRSSNRQPVIINWQHCQRCGKPFANWSDCPDCNKDAR